MKKLITILFLMLASLMYVGSIVTYIGCRYLPSNAAASFCSCEQAIVGALYQQEGEHPLHNAITSKVQGLFSINLFCQNSLTFWLKPILSNHSQKPIIIFNFYLPQGFMASIFRPPAIME